MKRQYTSYTLSNFYLFKYQLLNFGKRFSNFCFLDNHEYNFDPSFECVAGLGIIESITASAKNDLTALSQLVHQKKDWIFGHISYDAKNQIEDLVSEHKDHIGFPDFHFFIPEIIFILTKEKVTIGVYDTFDSQDIFNEILSLVPRQTDFKKPQITGRFSREEYLQIIQKLQQHILRGDCYEICFCQEFFSENVQLDPVKVFDKLSSLSPNPFAAFYKLGEKYLLCASPERFLKKSGQSIISQPIKGTSKRTGKDFKEEQNLLHNNEKERSENIMIVDLVRNDLSKICKEGSVSVKEFLKIYSFPQVHQMISTIEGVLRDNLSFEEILSATFPMGSMTGAPKKRAMELIEEYEKTKRGLFSGALGYFNPNGDFDFNVVIRSILYNEENQYLSIQAGSAITWKSIPEKEFEECRIKIEAMMEVVAN